MALIRIFVAAILAGVTAEGALASAAGRPEPSFAQDVPAPLIDPADRSRALELWRQAKKLPDPSPKKVELLDQAVTLDPLMPGYREDLEQARAAVDAEKRAESARREAEASALAKSNRAAATRQTAADRYTRAHAAFTAGRLEEAARLVEEGLGEARALGDEQLLRDLADVQRQIAASERLRTLAWRGLALAGVGGLVVIALWFWKRKPRLEIVEGPGRGRIVRLEKELTTIGAVDTEADVVIPDPYRNISRRHCQIARSGRHFFLVDCSRNGTFLNGRAVPKNEPVLLRVNDEITLSDDVIMIFR